MSNDMSLENILSEIRVKLKDYAKIYSKKEYAVRKDIILPILHSLGWQIWNSSEVYPEFTVPGTFRVDYALCIDNIPKLLIEVKNTSKNPVNQDILHYMEQGWTPYGIVTNGVRWIFYRWRKEVLLDFDISSGRIDYVASKLRDTFTKDAVLGLPYTWMPPPSWTKPNAITIKWNNSKEVKFETSSWMDGWRQILTWLIEEGIINEKPIYRNRQCIIADNSDPFIEPKQIATGFWTENKKDPRLVWKDLYYLLQEYLSEDASLEADWFDYS